MKDRLLFLLKYFLFWIILFIIQKILFLIYNYQEASQYRFFDLSKVLFHGFILDASMTTYIMIIPSIIIVFGIYLNNKFIQYFIQGYTYLIAIPVLFLGVVDMSLYSYWGFKLDITPLLYLKTPGDAIASVALSEILLLLGIFFAFSYLVFFFYRKFLGGNMRCKRIHWMISIPIGFFTLGLLFIIARGGIGISTMNLSRVYFHKERFLNHSAINVTWNTLYSFIERNKLQTNYHFMDDLIAEEVLNKQLQDPPGEIPLRVKPRANILLIILESFSNKIISSLGGEEGVTPMLDSLCMKSIVFDSFYASGDRSDKGLVSIFSGYPAQPVTSIIDYPSKSEKLPFLYEKFSLNGYQTGFYYGGDINFANFKSYFSNPFVHKLITKTDFPPTDQIQKWGVPDGTLFNLLKSDIDASQSPFFYSCFTLSSHEPFDVPMKPVFGTSNRDQLSKNGFYYTDSVLHVFLSEASKSSWWENTLVIITSDHGSRSPGNTPNHTSEKFKIPMIWCGGAVLSMDTVINHVGSQIDIPATLLALFGFDHSEYPYSRNFLNPRSPDFTFYAFNNGFGCISPDGYVVYDNDFNKCLLEQGQNPQKSLQIGKAFLQLLSTDFLKK